MEIAYRYITTIDKPHADGIGLASDEYFHIHHCIVDLFNYPVSVLDEACGLTWGAHGLFEECVIRGAGKNILMGCGEDPDDPKEAQNADKIRAEQGKVFTFKHCLFEDFGRRGPEVQGGMTANLYNCVIRNWGHPERWDTRAFGAWAHRGGAIYAQHCVFRNDVFQAYWLADHIAHFGQAYSDRLPPKFKRKWTDYIKAIPGIFSRDAWLSGYKRALTAGVGGKVEARQCYADDGLVMDNIVGSMSEAQAMHLELDLDEMSEALHRKLVA